MVSELAGEGAMLLPAPASHAELRRVHLQRQIRRGSLLRRGVTRSKQVFLLFFSFNLLSEDRSAVLFFKPSQSWSRSVKVLSKVLISHLFAIFNLNGFVKISDRVFVNLRFIAFSCSSWSRSVESTSTVLVKKLDKDLDDDEKLKAVNKVRSRRKSRTDQAVGGDLGENQADRSRVRLVRGGQQVPIVKIDAREWRCLVSMDGVRVWFSLWTSEWYAKEDSPLAVVWIQLPFLPIHLFKLDRIVAICEPIGREIALGSAIIHRTEPNLAKVRVEIDVWKHVVEKVSEVTKEFHDANWSDLLESHKLEELILSNNLYVVEGMQFDRGHIFPYFVNDNEKMVVEYEICKLLLVEKKIKNAGDLVNVLEEAIRGGCPIIVVAEDIEQEPLATLVVNKLRGSLKIVAVKAPGYECFKDVDIKVDTTILGLDDEIQRSLHDALNGVMEDRYSVLITLVNQFAADGLYCSYNDNSGEPICSEFDGQQDGEISQNDQLTCRFKDKQF